VGIPEETIYSLVTRAAIGSMIGARLAYVLNHPGEFANPLEIFAVWKGGISLLGGITGAVLAGVPKMRAEGLSFWKTMDLAVPCVTMGIIVGRLGDLVIGDHLGKPTSWLLAFRYEDGTLSGYDCAQRVCRGAFLGGRFVQQITPQGATLQGPGGEVLAQGIGVHQTALYDLLLTTVLVLLLVWMSRSPRRTGVLFFTYVAWYGVGRIITDFLRVENRFLGLTGSQWTSIAAVTLALLTLAWFALRPERPGPGPPQPVAGRAEAPAG
jgi:phosphatidylglycerol:prolipoprotein diacylglycerol transferase